MAVKVLSTLAAKLRTAEARAAMAAGGLEPEQN